MPQYSVHPRCQWLLINLVLAASKVTAGDVPPTFEDIVVLSGTPLPGAPVSLDRIPGNALILTAADLTREGSASLTGALNAQFSSISVSDNLDDPYQPDILYRGFAASPVLGTPQGLAVYQNGVRINEAFGDTVNWDLLPDMAIQNVQLVSSSPLYGLNALGGALSVATKNGFTAPGTSLEASVGSYRRRSLEGEFGWSGGVLGAYVAARVADSAGWRLFSSDRIRSLYTAASLHTQRLTLELSYEHADNTLNGQGSAPVQELAVNRALVFTGPQQNTNRLDFVSANATATLGHGWSVQGLAYYRSYRQRVSNGNTTSYVPCSTPPDILCQPDGTTPLSNASGQPLPDISAGGSVPIGENDFESIRAWSRGITLQVASNQAWWGHENTLGAGISLDYASTSFYTGAQIGQLSPQLLVLPSDLLVYTPESSDAAIANGDPVPVSVGSVNKNLGFYFTDTFNVTPALALTASGRYNISHVDLADELGSNLNGHNRFVHFNPSLGATYAAAPALTIYGSLSVNTRTPTASEIECSDPLAPCLLPTNLAGDPPNLRQVIAHTSELGLRGRIVTDGGQREFTWSAGVFRTLLHDDIFGISTSVSQGFFQNIGDTRRQGFEAGAGFHDPRWRGFLNYSYIQATFESPLRVPTPSNPYQDDAGNVQVEPGNRLPGIPRHRLKLGLDYRILPDWWVGSTVNVVSSVFYVGDPSNRIAPLPGYTTVGLHTTYRPTSRLEIFASVSNLFNRKYATWGILSDPTGIGAPGIPANASSNDPSVDNRFQSPAAPFQAVAGVRLKL